MTILIAMPAIEGPAVPVCFCDDRTSSCLQARQNFENDHVTLCLVSNVEVVRFWIEDAEMLQGTNI